MADLPTKKNIASIRQTKDAHWRPLAYFIIFSGSTRSRTIDSGLSLPLSFAAACASNVAALLCGTE